MNEREQRGLVIAATSKIDRKGGNWLVPSASGKGKYEVCLGENEDECTCTCPDHETRRQKCKHIYAVEIAYRREQGEDGSITETKSITITETRKTYPQNWKAYNAAQVNEKHQFVSLLHSLCKGVPEFPANPKGGCQRIPRPDAIFSAVFKVYSTVSGRRFMSDLRDAKDKGYIGRTPCYNSIFGVLESEETFDVLKSLVVESARPLRALESTFAPDSTGFSGCRFDRWFDHKWGKHECRRAWTKCHIMTGTKTNIVTAVEILDQHANDGAQMPALLATTANSFAWVE